MSTITPTQTYHITGMDCASCARTVETGVAKLADVVTANLSFATGTLRVEGTVSADEVIGRVRDLGYDVAPANGSESEAVTSAHTYEQDSGHDHDVPAEAPRQGLLAYLWQRPDTRLALFGAILILPGLIFEELLGGAIISSPIFDAMAVAAMVLAGLPIARSAWRALRINHEITINLLMTIAAIGAVIIGAYTEAGLVMVLFAIGEALEGYTASRARQSISGLATLAPPTATLLRASNSNGTTAEVVVPVETLVVGDLILAKPGERIPMDGRVVAGQSAVNQAAITGESRPVDKAPGDEVLASSINGTGSLEIAVTHLAADNTISRLIAMVEEAQERRAPAQRFVDQFARYYTPAVIVIALLVATIPPLFFGEPFLNPSPEVTGWLYRALALLVVACPCALVISTPVTLVSAISNGARNGVIFKGGAYLEELSRVRAMAMDKTGTITRGEPAVIAVRSVGCTTDHQAACLSCDDLLAMAAAVERRSEHPLAQAVVLEAADRGLDARYSAGVDVQALAGKGVTGQVGNRLVTIGSHAYFDDEFAHAADCAAVSSADAQGYTTMLVSSNGGYQGFIALSDTPRKGSAKAIAQLRDLGIDPLVMLTGDSAATAQQIAATVGITDVQSNCLPADKVARVEALRAEHEHVAMVGDGINDTPALAAATIGIAMGRTAQALETADVVLLGDDLRQLPFAVHLAQMAMNTVRANVALSIGIKLIFFLLVLVGTGSMWMAVLADVGTSLLVSLNGMRLLRSPRLEIGVEVDPPTSDYLPALGR